MDRARRQRLCDRRHHGYSTRNHPTLANEPTTGTPIRGSMATPGRRLLRVLTRPLPRRRVSLAGRNDPDDRLGRSLSGHGPGRKHERRIELADWQLRITTAFPRELLRGLIHSDGCRTINRFKTKLPSGRVASYEYPRYFFSNLSDDIRGIFCEHCALLGIRWTQSNPRNISVSHRTSVALMDEFIGPKS